MRNPYEFETSDEKLDRLIKETDNYLTMVKEVMSMKAVKLKKQKGVKKSKAKSPPADFDKTKKKKKK